MAGTFMLGETKIRPGAYFNIQKNGTNPATGILNGVTVVVFKSDFGPLGKVVELTPEEGYEPTFGNALTTDAIREAIAGGATTILAVRLGDGGAQANIKLIGTVDGDNPQERGWYVKENDSYILATDTVAVEGKVYYEQGEETVYNAVTPAQGDNPSANGWYEKSGNDYVATTDTEVNAEKTYYKAETQAYYTEVEGVVYGGSIEAVSIVSKYPGEKAFTATIRTKLADPTVKECIIYAGTSIFEKVEFDASSNETEALAEAFARSKRFDAFVLRDGAVMNAVSQQAFTAGENPVVTTSSYSDAFALAEPYEFNTICVDTEDTGIHLLLQSFINRIFNAGSLAQAVVAEKHTVDLDTRMAHAVSFNDEKMNYVLNAYVNELGEEIDGYQTAARIAGMIGAVYAGSSLTHTVVSGFSELLEALTNTEIITAEKKGCIVLSLNTEKQVWIDNAINTLITPADNQDDGWKKIRRVKTRFEFIRRVNKTTDALVGKIDNDSNGRATVMAQISGIGKDMIAEGKLMQVKVAESSTYKADGDSAWFDIDVVDKDSMEHIYLTYCFQYSTNIE